MAIAACLYEYLQAHGVACTLLCHPHTETSRATARSAAVPADHLAKGVLLHDARGSVLAVIPADHHLRLHTCRGLLRRDLELAAEDDLTGLFPDCEPGAIPAIGPAYGVETWMDEALASLGEVYCEAGDHESLLQLSGEEFRGLLGRDRRGWLSHAG